MDVLNAIQQCTVSQTPKVKQILYELFSMPSVHTGGVTEAYLRINIIIRVTLPYSVRCQIINQGKKEVDRTPDTLYSKS